MDGERRDSSPAHGAHGGRPKYRLALSYAEAQSDYVAKFAAVLRERGIEFFDPATDPSLLGAYTPAEIQSIFQTETPHVILFISAEYVADVRARIEHRAAVDRALKVDRFALPAYFDDSVLPGLSENIGGLKLATNGEGGLAAEEFAEKAVEWLLKMEQRAGPYPVARAAVAFAPAKLNCVVVTSEQEASAGWRGLSALFTKVLAGTEGDAVWAAAYGALLDTTNLSGPRELPRQHSPGDIRRTEISVVEAFASDRDLQRAVQLIVEADLAVFDVTNFEPGVMLLLGARAASRRGVTIASHGGDWLEGKPKNRPFNLADLSLASHVPSNDVQAGEEPRVARLSRRIQTGFRQLGLHSGYRDLPVYDALRNLGADPAAWTPILLAREVLVLCSYNKDYTGGTWGALNDAVGTALFSRNVGGTTISRMLDVATPQIVSQALYEKIRRCVGCVADWSYGSPSTFFELGVRLLASPWGTVQLASRAWLDGELGPDVPPPPPRQMAGMLRLFDPVIYTPETMPAIGGRIADRLVAISESGGTSGHEIRRVAAAALQHVEPKLPEVPVALVARADELDLALEQELFPQTLFFEAESIKEDHERTAIEQRLAAWLYLEHRVRVREPAMDEPLRVLWLRLGKQVAKILMESEDEADFDLGLEISGIVEAE